MIERKNFSCKCGCGKDTVDYELGYVLQDLAEHFSTVVHINSGNRCTQHNSDVGGAVNSQHLRGKAADVTLPNVPPKQVCDFFKARYPDKYGIGSYNTFTHIDVRERKARW